jgi:hypothetical protein
MTRKFGLMSILMTAVLLAVLAVPAAQAVGYETVTLTDKTRVNPVQYQVTVLNPGTVSQSDDYINMTVYVEPLGTGAAHTTFQVLFYLNDGTTNTSLGNKTLAAVDDATVWSNLSYNSVGMVALALNGTARLTIELWYLNLTATPDDYQMLDASVSTFGIYNNSWTETVGALIPVVVTLGVLSVILPAFVKKSKGLGKKR